MQTKVNDNLFAGQSIYVGIDYHKKSWKVTILGDQYEHKTMSQNPNPEILANYLKRIFQVHLTKRLRGWILWF